MATGMLTGKTKGNVSMHMKVFQNYVTQYPVTQYPVTQYLRREVRNGDGLWVI